MRFGIKPERPDFLERTRSRYGSSTYKLPSDSEDSSSDEFEEAVVEEEEGSDSDDSFIYASESEIPAKLKGKGRQTKTASEQRELTEAMASIQLHSQYQDPLDDWKKRNQKEAFMAAHARMKQTQIKAMTTYVSTTRLGTAGLELLSLKQNEQFAKLIEQRLSEKEAREREELKSWEERNRRLWEQVDRAASVVEARLEAERKAAEAEAKRVQDERDQRDREERERRERAEAEKRRVAEEKARAEQEEKRARELEEKERIEAEEKQRLERDQLSKFDVERKKAGITTSGEDWEAAMTVNQGIKIGHLKRVKEDSIQRRQWTAIRRNLTLRIGQLTDDASEIARISNIIFDAIKVLDPSSDLYPSALSALAKAIILQAETEVTAKLDTAAPLAAVVINLFNLPGFEDVLWSKMVVRTGGWLIGHCVTRRPGQDESVFRKLASYREDEPPVDRQVRIGGVVSLYFAIATSPRASNTVLPTKFWPTKIWSFLARIMGDSRLLRQAMAPFLMHASLEVVASAGMTMFGKQWIKLLLAIGQATTIEGRVGSNDDAGKTARIRLQLKAEKLLGDYGVRV